MSKIKNQKAPPSSIVQKLIVKTEPQVKQEKITDTEPLIDAATTKELQRLINATSSHVTSNHLNAEVDLAFKIGDTLIIFGWAQDQISSLQSVEVDKKSDNLINNLRRFFRDDLHDSKSNHNSGFLLLVNSLNSNSCGVLTLSTVDVRISLNYQLTQKLKSSPIFNRYLKVLIDAANQLGFDNIHKILMPYINSVSFGLDPLSKNQVTGWVFDENHPEKTFIVVAKLGQFVIGSVASNDWVNNDRRGSFELTINLSELQQTAISTINIEIPELDIIIGSIDLATKSSKLAMVHKNDRKTSQIVQGNFEKVEAKSHSVKVTGWAFTPEESATKIEVYLNDRLVCADYTTQSRPDLYLANITEKNAGFNIQIPSTEIFSLENKVEILANGQPLLGGPKKLNFINQLKLELVGVKYGRLNVRLKGWPGQSFNVRIIVDGLAIGELSLEQDVKSMEHYGQFVLPFEYLDARNHVYYLEGTNENASLRSDLVIYSYPYYEFHIDQSDSEVITGWGFRHDIHRSLEIQVTTEDAELNVEIKKIIRIDVVNAKNRKNSDVGFEINLKTVINKSVNSTFYLKDKETGVSFAKIETWPQYESLQSMAQYIHDKGNPAWRSALAEIIVKTGQASLSKATLFPIKAEYQDVVSHLDIIIPVYGGLLETVECIESVLDAKNETTSRIIIVDDCSPDSKIQTYLDKLEERKTPNLMMFRKKRNGGFSESVNLGMLVAGRNDVVLLNADTVVQNHWLDKIAKAVSQDKKIATATTLSNNAEICTVPYMCKTLPVKSSAFAAMVDQAAERVNSKKLVDIPVGVGFCMYIRRSAIDEIGLFDAAKWGRGYGEEVDFCLKAAARGWRNVLVTDTFIIHRGGVSFGDEKLKRVLESAKKITQAYPFYDALIQRFIKDDPVNSYRRAINLELIKNALKPKRVLHVMHSYGGGTERYLRDLIEMGDAEGYESLILRFNDDKTITLDTDLANTDLLGFFFAKHQEIYSSDELQTLQQDIADFHFDFVHVHAPFNVPSVFLDWLKSYQKYVVTIHDYAWLCPRVTLNREEGKYCGEPDVKTCDTCVSSYKPHQGLASFINEFGSVEKYKSYFASFIESADKVLTGAADVKHRLEAHGYKGDLRVIPHPQPVGPSRKVPQSNLVTQTKSSELRVALIGGISPCKGYFQLLECAEQALKRRLPIKFFVFGYTANDQAFMDLPNVQILGKYLEEELPDLIQLYQPNVAFFPNQCPETFSYTLSTCFENALWPIAANLGAPAERIQNAVFGTLYSIDRNTNKILDLIMDVGQELKALKQRSIPELTKYPQSFVQYYKV